MPILENWGREVLAPVFHDLGTRREWVVSITPRPHFTPGKEPPVPIVQEAGWAPEPVWTQRLEEKSSASVGDRSPVAQSEANHYNDWATPAHQRCNDFFSNCYDLGNTNYWTILLQELSCLKINTFWCITDIVLIIHMLTCYVKITPPYTFLRQVSGVTMRHVGYFTNRKFFGRSIWLQIGKK
jgi:hypothetical protein